MTPNDFIQGHLKKACKMMVEGEYRLTEIGFLVGFSSSSYFAKCFQKQFGMLPTEFLKKIKEAPLIRNKKVGKHSPSKLNLKILLNSPYK